MKRRFTALLLICLLAFSMVSSVSAAEARRATVVPRLSFTGTRANCKLSITEVGAMQRWNCGTALYLWIRGTKRGHPRFSSRKRRPCKAGRPIR